MNTAAYAWGQQSALHDLGLVKHAGVFDSLRRAMSPAAHAAAPSGVHVAQGPGAAELLRRGAQGLTEAGQARVPGMTGIEQGFVRQHVPEVPVPSVKKNPTLALGNQVQNLNALQQGAAPVGNADMLRALESMSFEGLGNLTAHAPAAAPSRLSGVLQHPDDAAGIAGLARQFQAMGPAPATGAGGRQLHRVSDLRAMAGV